MHWNHTFHVPTDPLRPWNIPLDSQSVIAVPVTGKYELSALSSSLTVWYAMREIIMYRKPIPVCTKYYMNYLLFELGYIVYLTNVTCLCRERFSCNKTNTLNIFYFCHLYFGLFVWPLVAEWRLFSVFFSGCNEIGSNWEKRAISQVCMGWVIKYHFKLLEIRCRC